MEYVVASLILLAVLVVGAVGLVVPRLRRRELPPPGESRPGETRAGTTTLERPPVAPPAPEAEALPPLIERPAAPPAEPVVEAPAKPALEKPEPTAGRLVRLRARLSRSQNVFGRGLLSVLSRDHLDEDAWEEIEDSLITADVGVEATQVLVERLRERVRVLGTRTVAGVREQLAEELTAALDPQLDRGLRTAPHDGRPATVLVVGVNGAGKTTTCGKIARVLVADGRTVLLGAADTFRAAAADQLTTWGERVGAETVRGPEGGDPASVAFDAVKRGIDVGVDTVLIDTAGRLQNKVGLMDELGKVKRVVEKHGPVDETLLILDATTGQNGLEQARVFTEVVDVTGVVLTKLDGTAKGGIVIAVQRKLGIPVKLVGLGEGPDDLAPFEPAAFVEALLGADA
ncbi:signal recognition particle-docking protein FtsY [Couchioplanes caeruleus]|uniref:Signal recognition particle receptor FtsY n=2 Tax=Couchioplanes caeruleus TaxID=56438 RepID=A0A1K0GR87_9ACTN|nr:signal recognition particle-docking protein FtsY [Couchioplanes caeruleus]OJF13700.1 signal recognition particle-docking protein FtsY [Couchioplanes caeruleus subsp. caeruleus]ROP32486.1 signal recognition particle-docking protein FtsY [Couchioplanes caeruleus]